MCKPETQCRSCRGSNVFPTHKGHLSELLDVVFFECADCGFVTGRPMPIDPPLDFSSALLSRQERSDWADAEEERRQDAWNR